mgnify:CR=1 FL=1
MSWADVGQIAVASIASAGGIGAIMIGVVSFSAKRIADRMNAKFEATLNKELEKYKTELTKKEYVSKARFDVEFKIYRELSQVFSEAIEGVHGIIPYGEAYYPVNEDERKDYEQQSFIEFAKASYQAQKALFSNAPFISKDIYDKFEEIMCLIRTQSEVYNEAYLVTTVSNAEGKITDEDVCRTALIDKKFELLTDEIRTYLSGLEILEDKHNG